MKPEKALAGKYVLIVDDEQDVLDTLVELLDMCRLDTAASFSEAKSLLEENDYDIAVLDIMGVDGYELLKVANGRNIPALMLTARSACISSDSNCLRSVTSRPNESMAGRPSCSTAIELTSITSG